MHHDLRNQHCRPRNAGRALAGRAGRCQCGARASAGASAGAGARAVPGAGAGARRCPGRCRCGGRWHVLCARWCQCRTSLDADAGGEPTRQPALGTRVRHQALSPRSLEPRRDRLLVVASGTRRYPDETWRLAMCSSLRWRYGLVGPAAFCRRRRPRRVRAKPHIRSRRRRHRCAAGGPARRDRHHSEHRHRPDAHGHDRRGRPVRRSRRCRRKAATRSQVETRRASPPRSAKTWSSTPASASCSTSR